MSEKADFEEVQRALSEVESQLASLPPQDDRVSKIELQYLLANKVSIQEISRILENKANNHEINETVKGLDDRVQHLYEDILKKT